MGPNIIRVRKSNTTLLLLLLQLSKLPEMVFRIMHSLLPEEKQHKVNGGVREAEKYVSY